jgi:Tol biopolymer transport system component/DNA-binding winged helix-turn-helix (wHTH) protein
MASQLLDMNDNVQERMRFGPFEADVHTRELWRSGVRIKLIGQPFEILTVLLSKPGRLVTREELRSRLWPADTFVDFNHGLNAAINKLRDALCDSAENPKYIETLPRRGYRFIATVERVRDGSIEGPEPIQVIDTELPGNGVAVTESQLTDEPHLGFANAIPQRTTPAFQKRRLWLPLITPALLLIALLLAYLTWSYFSPKSESPRVGRRASVTATPLTDLADPTSDPAFSPDGNRVAFRRQGYASENSGIFVKTIGSQQLSQLTNDPADCCPVWAPNGRSVAFSRFSDKEHEIYTVSSAGGGLHKLYTTAIGPKHGELDWSPDGNSIAFVGQSSQGTSSIFVLSKDRSARRITEAAALDRDWGPAWRITEPAALDRDWGPVFSPDGQSLAFIRTRESGLPENIVVMPAGGGESRIVVAFYNGILGPPAWTEDGQSLVFASGADPMLLRAPVFGGQEITRVQEAGTPAWHPAIAHKGNYLAYQNLAQTMSIRELNPRSPRATNSRPVVVTEKGRNEGAQLSPDGKKLAFMSNRSGTMEIWISDRDGSHPFQLTDMRGAGTPRWSPNGRSIAFDVGWRDRGAIFVVDVAGTGVPRPLAQNNSDNLVPNWSRDGKWLYFASDRTGMWQVWKAPVQGGPAVQVTTHGGFAAYPSTDGKTLYYSKGNMPSPEVWRIPIQGGIETRVSPVRPEDWASWAPIDKGIYFVGKDRSEQANVMFFDFASSEVKKISKLDKLPFWLSASADGNAVFYEHLDQESSHIMLMKNFQ